MSRSDRHLIRHLEIGQTGYIHIFTDSLCVDDTNRLFVVNYKAFETTQPSFSGSFRITRVESGFVLEPNWPSDNRMTPPERFNHVATALARAAHVRCQEILNTEGAISAGDVLVPVVRLANTSSLSELLEAGFPQPSSAAHRQTPSTATVSPAVLEWNLRTDRDAITDQLNVFVTGLSANRAFTAAGSDYRGSVVIRCQRNVTSIIILFEDYLVDDSTQVTWRLDSKPARSSRWNVATNRKAVGLWSGREAIPFLRELVTAKMVRFRIEGRSNDIDLEFDLTGLPDKVPAVASACGWAM
jgi:type VI secretion system protein VasI